MKPKEKIVIALEKLARGQDVRQMSLSEISRASGVSWPTVRRHVGGPEGLAAFIEREGIPVAEHAGASQVDQNKVREAILEAAFRVFAEKGYPGSSIDAVAQEAGLTKGAIYWHFKNKKDLFRELMVWRSSDGVAIGPARMEQAQTESAGDAQKFVAKLIDHQIDLAEEERDWWWLTFENLTEARDPELRTDLAAGMRALLKANEDLIQSMKGADLIAESVDDEGMSTLWQAMLIGFGYLNLMDPELIQDRNLGAKIARSLWLGLAPENRK